MARSTCAPVLRLNTPGAGYAGLVIAAAGWTEPDVALLVGAPVEAWRELTAGEVQAMAARQVVGALDTR